MAGRADSRKTKPELLEEIEGLQQRIAVLEARLLAVNELNESADRYRILLDESSDPIFSFYPDGTYRYANKAFAEGVGRNIEEIIDHKIWDIFDPEEAEKRYTVVRRVFATGKLEVIEVRVPREDGDHYYITTAKPIFDAQGQVITVICISKDITARKYMEQELHYMGTHDFLTGLYNRNFFEMELERFQNSRFFPVGILIADMDNLKTVNDNNGHAAGDQALRSIALVLRASLRAEDIIARIGGDEFAVLLPNIDPETADTIVTRLRQNLAEHNESWLHLSIGIAIGSAGDNLRATMRLADDRMYQDKTAHKVQQSVPLVNVRLS